MRIEIENFIIVKADAGINKFDISRKVTIKVGKRAGEIVERNEAYGVTFKRALEIIIHETVFEKEGAVCCDKYLNRYEEISNKVIEEAKKLIKD